MHQRSFDKLTLLKKSILFGAMQHDLVVAYTFPLIFAGEYRRARSSADGSLGPSVLTRWISAMRERMGGLAVTIREDPIRVAVSE